MSITKRQQQQKQALCEQLRKTPIVQITCEKIGVGRATYYRWRKDDKVFAKQSDEALSEGVHLMNDMAESQLLSAIKSQNMTAIIFWLKNRHKSYTQKFEVTTRIDNPDLTEEQQAMVQKALALGSLVSLKKSPKD
jgi:hypothetical protein